MKRSNKLMLATATVLSLAACATTREAATAPQIEQVATFEGAMPTGVTVAPNGRIFVNFPQWDLAAVRLRRLKRRLLSEADIRRSPDRHRGT